MAGKGGTLLLDPEDIVISDFSPQPGDIPSLEQSLEEMSGDTNVEIVANNNIVIENLENNELLFPAGNGSITFIANASGNGIGRFYVAPGITLRAIGRSVTIVAEQIDAQTIDTSASNGVSGGDITLTANRTITTGSLISSSYGSGDGGKIALTSQTGGIDTTGGFVSSFSTEGNAGKITLEAAGDIRTYQLDARASGTGGDITLTTQMGEITATDFIDTSSSFGGNGNGGQIQLNAARDITTGIVFSSTYGTGQAGNITLASTGGGINTTAGYVSAFSTEGDAGAIQLTASNDITTGTVVAGSYGNGRGGDITLASSDGSIDTTTGTVQTFGTQGGAVQLTANQNIATGDLGSGPQGIEVTANQSVTTGALVSQQGNIAVSSSQGTVSTGDIGSNGGDVSITSKQDNSIGNVASSGGKIELLSRNGSITTGYLRSDGAGRGGAIDVRAPQGLFSATNSTLVDGIEYSIYTGFDERSTITIQHNGLQEGVPFVVGALTSNGTVGAISTEYFTIFPPGESISFPESVVVGDIRIIASEADLNLLDVEDPISIVIRNSFEELIADANTSIGGPIGSFAAFSRALSGLIITAAYGNSAYTDPNDRVRVANAASQAIPLLLNNAVKYNLSNPAHFAYILATAGHESLFGAYNTSAFRGRSAMYENSGEVLGSPEDIAYFVREYGSRSDLGNLTDADGYVFRGRGYVQLTGRDMYDRLGKRIGINLLENPELAVDPQIAAKIAVIGMKEGLFVQSGSLSDYIPSGNSTEFYNARELVAGAGFRNQDGGPADAAGIATMAGKYLIFLQSVNYPSFSP